MTRVGDWMRKKISIEKIKRVFRQKSMIVTIILILLLASSTILATDWLNRLEEETCFSRLYEEARNLGREIEDHVDNDREQLKMLAVIIAKYENFTSPELWEILDSYSTTGMISRIELLLPDNTVLTAGGAKVETNGELSFEKEASLGVHITDRETEIGKKDVYVIRHYVPVVRDGKTAAMLYGVTDLENLPEEMRMQPYSGQAAIYIVDGKTGEFLVDTWHEEQGNIWEMGNRQMAPGYDHEQLKQGMINGESRYVIFVSKTIGEYLYFYYEPLAVNAWRLALSVPESVVFANADTIQTVLHVFAAFETVCFILYFLWMLHYSKQASEEKQRQLDTIHSIYDVENLLFNAHEKRKNVELALEKVGYLLSAESVEFWMQGPFDEENSFVWVKDQTEGIVLLSREVIEFLKSYFEKGNRHFEAYGEDILQSRLPGIQTGVIRNLLAAPVGDQKDESRGILIGCNVSDKRSGVISLESISISFRMFCRNMQSYSAMKVRGEKDILSGLYNRNRYEMDLQKLRKYEGESIACIYIDVNGLHERNNQKGHAEGDRMLQLVAAQIREKFGTEYTYRIGGDEFLAFVMRTEESAAVLKAEEMKKSLWEKEIYISFGIQWQTGAISLDSLIKEAERKMYQDKRAYYEKEENDRRQRCR